MKIPGISAFWAGDWSDSCLRLDDGRVWSTKLVKFVDDDFVRAWLERNSLAEVPLCGVNPTPDADDMVGSGPHDQEGLRRQLVLFGQPTGELGSVEERFEALRAKREARISATDYLMMPDYPLPEEQRTELLAYRQALRDLPAREGAPWDGGGDETPWPQAPAGI